MKNMIMIKIEIWPGGDERQKKVIQEMKITNVGDHPYRPLYGNYKVELQEKKATISHHDRRDNIWHLINKAINAIIKKHKL
jgi:hypothetical protein